MVGVVAVTTDFMRPGDEAGVRALHATCYPTWPVYPVAWYRTHPTLVVRSGRRIIGCTSFSLSFPPQLIPHEGEVCYGHGVAVHPAERGKGMGMVLAEARHQAAKDGGAFFFIGMTWASNHSMIRIFERQRLKPHQVIIGAYPWHDRSDQAGHLYVGPIQ